MKNIWMLILVFALGLTSCKNDKKDDDTDDMTTTEKTDAEYAKESEMETPKKVTVQLNSKSGSSATGTVVFKEEDGEVKMTALLEGLEAGTHAIHIHENADCSAEDGTSAGGHWNPTFEDHGKWGDEEGYHKGDIGNFEVDESGNGSISMTTDEWCIGCDDNAKNILNKSVIVHQGADDFTSQPSGAAGSRVSCGGIISE
ncbi:MAG: superoxide dismutase family protein [Leeuwenhoekiella sp.]